MAFGPLQIYADGEFYAPLPWALEPSLFNIACFDSGLQPSEPATGSVCVCVCVCVLIQVYSVGLALLPMSQGKLYNGTS